MKSITDDDYSTACANGDGTYDGRKAVRWVFEALTGKPMTAAEADALIEEAKQRAAKKGG